MRRPSRALLLALAVLAVATASPARLPALQPSPPPDVGTDDALLEAIQRASFSFFREQSNPANGLVRDRSRADSKCSIAAVGFGLSAWCIAVERGWVSRDEAAGRVDVTLTAFLRGPQGPMPDGVMGHQGWFYHFLEMDSGHRAWKCELSSIDTALLLAGAMDASVFFDGHAPVERRIRTSADAILARVNWRWMCNGSDVLSMGWHPESGFIARHWVGYNEAMLLYILALGARTGPLPPSAWDGWTRGYVLAEHHGQRYVDFAPLFGHQYSHCWIDFRGRPDAWMARAGLDYFENSRRAVLAQRAHCIHNPLQHAGYSADLWGITACDGPNGYAARGAPPIENDDGTLAPTAMVASLPFAPEIVMPSLRVLHREWGTRLWTRHGYRDAFNPGKDWVAEDVLGIDQGPMVLMIENYRTGATWRRMAAHPVIRTGLRRAGFAAP